MRSTHSAKNTSTGKEQNLDDCSRIDFRKIINAIDALKKELQDDDDTDNQEQSFRVITNSDDDSGSSGDLSDDDEPSFLNTYAQWTLQENEWLWEQHSRGTPIHEICKGLDRYPDDVIVYMCTHSHLRPSDIQGFGGPCHLALWKDQQEAFQTNPLFELRKEIRRQETDDRICDMLRLLLNRK